MNNYFIIKGEITSESKLLQFDGLSFPNPGISTSGAVLFDSNNSKVLFEVGEYIGHATNNQAEYTGLIIGLKKAIEFGFMDILIEGDSLLVINQTIGKWKVNNDILRGLNTEVKELLTRFNSIGIRHVYRENNKYSDRITNDVLKSKKSYFLNMT